MSKLSGLFFCFPGLCCCKPKASKRSVVKPLLNKKNSSNSVLAQYGGSGDDASEDDVPVPNYGPGVVASREFPWPAEVEDASRGYGALHPIHRKCTVS